MTDEQKQKYKAMAEESQAQHERDVEFCKPPKRPGNPYNFFSTSPEMLEKMETERVKMYMPLRQKFLSEHWNNCSDEEFKKWEAMSHADHVRAVLEQKDYYFIYER